MRLDRPSSAGKTHSSFVCTVSPTIDRNCRPRSAKAVPHGGEKELFLASRPPSEKTQYLQYDRMCYHRSEHGNRCKYAALPEIHMACRTIATEQD
jgi:hypothetical protein